MTAIEERVVALLNIRVETWHSLQSKRLDVVVRAGGVPDNEVEKMAEDVFHDLFEQ